MVKEKIQELNSDDFVIKSVNVNRSFVSVTYDSELENNAVKELFVEKLDSEELFGIDFKSDSGPNSDEMFDVIEFRIK